MKNKNMLFWYALMIVFVVVNAYMIFHNLGKEYLIPVDGNIDNFLSDPNALLILDKDLWDEYSGVLTGHVILNDSSYLVLSSDMY